MVFCGWIPCLCHHGFLFGVDGIGRMKITHYEWSDRKQRVVKRRIARAIKQINMGLAIFVVFMSVVTIIFYITKG
jgi:hypothetical protein